MPDTPTTSGNNTTPTTDLHTLAAQTAATHIPTPPHPVTANHIAAALTHAHTHNIPPALLRTHIQRRNPNATPHTNTPQNWTRLVTQTRAHVRHAQAREVAAGDSSSASAAQQAVLVRWRRDQVRATVAALAACPIGRASSPAMMAAAHVLCAQLADPRGWDTTLLSASDAGLLSGRSARAGSSTVEQVEKLRLLRRTSSTGRRGRVPRWRLPAQPRGDRVAAGRSIAQILDGLVDDLCASQPAGLLAAVLRSVRHPAWCWSDRLGPVMWAEMLHWACALEGVPVAPPKEPKPKKPKSPKKPKRRRRRRQTIDDAGLVACRTGDDLRRLLDEISRESGAGERQQAAAAVRRAAAAERRAEVVAYRAGRIVDRIIAAAGHPADMTDKTERAGWAATAADIIASRTRLPHPDRVEIGRQLTALLTDAGWGVERSQAVVDRILTPPVG